MKHLLYITPGFADGESDSSCIPALQVFCKQMGAKSEIKITILALGYPTQEKEYLWNGISVYSCGGKYLKWPLKILTYFKAFKKIKRINITQKIDFIHSFWLHDAGLIGGYFSRKFNIPQVITIMGQDALASNKFLPFFKKSKATFVSLSVYQKTIFEKNLKVNSKIIPWGIDLKEFLSISNHEIEFDILGVASLIELKQLEHFLKVIAHLKKHKPSVKVAVIGDGILRIKLEDFVKKIGLIDNVKFMGSIKRPEVLEYMLKSKILLHTSSYESFGYVLVEALASGMEVVSYPVGIANELSKIKKGNTIEELTKHLNKILSEPYLPKKNIPFKIEDTCEKYMNLYNSNT
jgi:1,2-diacylglycerol 3-alpha-glucosyltransferase